MNDDTIATYFRKISEIFGNMIGLAIESGEKENFVRQKLIEEPNDPIFQSFLRFFFLMHMNNTTIRPKGKGSWIDCPKGKDCCQCVSHYFVYRLLSIAGTEYEFHDPSVGCYMFHNFIHIGNVKRRVKEFFENPIYTPNFCKIIIQQFYQNIVSIEFEKYNLMPVYLDKDVLNIPVFCIENRFRERSETPEVSPSPEETSRSRRIKEIQERDRSISIEVLKEQLGY